MNLILLEPDDVSASGRAVLAGERARHIVDVLDARAGQQVRVGLVNGPAGMACVAELTGGAVALDCTFDEQPPARPPIDLLLAVPRPKVMRRLWSPLAQLGVGSIILTNAWKVERNYFDTHVLSEHVYRPLLIEGLQQARDTLLPRVSIHRQFRKLVENELDALFPDGMRIVADPAAPASLTAMAAMARGRRMLLAIGPEGGWTPFELDLLEAHSFARAGMGVRTLRTDVACIAALSQARASMQ
ncbi:16S rRNA (uracil(1498)-N(3))-methyltransferase [bacterium]|nr:16S rRNA (uracil(1498)-N(3))-methyltransferase [bacterium]